MMTHRAYYTSEEGFVCHPDRATHCTVIYEHASAGLDDPRNQTRSYLMIPLQQPKQRR